MLIKSSNSNLYNKYLNNNELVGVAYYPSKNSGFQFLLIIKSGIKVDFVKYNFISYRELFNISLEEELIISPEKMMDMISILDKIYIPLRDIKGYSYEKLDGYYNIYLRINDGSKTEYKLINKLDEADFEILDDGYQNIKEEKIKEGNKKFKELRLGINS